MVMTQNKISKVITGSAILVTLIITPWLNVDSMVIPKLIVLSFTAFLLLPEAFKFIVSNLRKTSLSINILQITVALILIQMTLVLFITEAPFEQQFFGKTGRGLGYISYFSLLVLILIASRVFDTSNIKVVSQGLFFSSLISGMYSILQFYGLDIFSWSSRTNGIIGTIGNPNFQSSFSGIAILSSVLYYSSKDIIRKIIGLGHSLVLLYAIYLCQSWQGYALVVISLALLIGYYLRLKKVLLFRLFSFFMLGTGTVVALGVLNIGPLSQILFKYSIKSRTEMWRSSIRTIKDNPGFGIGLDSFGDYSLYYKDPKDISGVNEFTDNSHNYYLEFATTGGIVLLALNLALIVLTLYSFTKILRQKNNFDFISISLFSAWVCFIAQSLISPATLPILTWNYIISGAVIGLASNDQQIKFLNNQNSNKRLLDGLASKTIFLTVIIVIMYPYFNVDRLYLQASRTGNGVLAIQVAQMYPESVLRYQRIGRELLESKLYDQALEVAKAASKFNPNSFSAWALIYVNPVTPAVDKEKAYIELKRVYPLNPELQP